MPLAAGAHRSRSSQRTLLLTAAFAAVLLFVLAAAAAPSTTLGATTTTKAALCNANLRTTAIGSSRIKKVTKTGHHRDRVGDRDRPVVQHDCAGKSVSGRTWIRISAVNGKSVKSLYGVTYLYAAAGLFKTVPVSKYAACAANLRSTAKAGRRRCRRSRSTRC